MNSEMDVIVVDFLKEWIRQEFTDLITKWKMY